MGVLVVAVGGRVVVVRVITAAGPPHPAELQGGDAGPAVGALGDGEEEAVAHACCCCGGGGCGGCGGGSS